MLDNFGFERSCSTRLIQPQETRDGMQMNVRDRFFVNAFIGGFLLFVAATEVWASTPAGYPQASSANKFLGDLRVGQFQLKPGEADILLNSPPGEKIRLSSFESFIGSVPGALTFHRIKLYSEGAELYHLNKGDSETLTPDPRLFYLGTNEIMGMGIAIDPASGEINGYANGQGRRLRIEGNLVSILNFTDLEPVPEGLADCLTEQQQQPASALLDLETPRALSSSAAAAGDLISFQAVVAIDTDTEWLSKKFSDDTSDALQWISDLFLAMNVFYERDVETQLLIGDTTLRTGSDPYSVASNRLAQLNEFGEYWMDNMGHIDRQFAAMFSGRSISSGSFSGIAWINQYCEYGRWVNGGNDVAGSYSYNAIGSNRSAGNTALYVGHEIAHNMGSRHTHCYSPPVDQCYNAEGGCYSGTPSCPAGGRGTIMSYCHVGGANGAGCGTSDSEFHPTVQELLESRLSSELVQGCILPYTLSSDLFSDGFE